MSGTPIKILLQTTIVPTEDDWSIARFSLLADLLSKAVGDNGQSLYDVTVRDRGRLDAPDPVLSTLDKSGFDQLWLFAVDTGNGLTPADCDAISRFRQVGGGLLVTRDHMDLGSSICALGGVGAAHFFHTPIKTPIRPRTCATIPTQPISRGRTSIPARTAITKRSFRYSPFTPS
jgi:hypothetical protein